MLSQHDSESPKHNLSILVCQRASTIIISCALSFHAKHLTMSSMAFIKNSKDGQLWWQLQRVMTCPANHSCKGQIKQIQEPQGDQLGPIFTIMIYIMGLGGLIGRGHVQLASFLLGNDQLNICSPQLLPRLSSYHMLHFHVFPRVRSIGSFLLPKCTIHA